MKTKRKKAQNKLELKTSRKNTSSARASTQVSGASQTKIATPLKRDRASTEDRLIKAGTYVFSRYGYDGATTKMISKESGVNESLIMRYFGGKEGLLLEIIRRFFKETRATPLPYEPQESLHQEFIHYIRYTFESAKQHNEVLRVMLLRASIDPIIRKKVLALIPQEGDPKLLERVKALKAKGKVPKHVAPRLVSLIAFQCFSANFISGFLFDRRMKEEIQSLLEKTALSAIHGLINNKSI